MSWAMDVPLDVVESATARHILLILANYADQEGRHAFPSVSTIARQTGLTVRSIRQNLAGLLELGVIKPGNQAIVAAHIDRADRRPVVYDLCITGVNLVHPDGTGGISRPNGVNLATERGESRSPKPSFNHPRAVAHAGARAGDKSPSQQQEQKPGEVSGRQPPAAEVIAKSKPSQVATKEAAAAHLAAIAKSLNLRSVKA